MDFARLHLPHAEGDELLGIRRPFQWPGEAIGGGTSGADRCGRATFRRLDENQGDPVFVVSGRNCETVEAEESGPASNSRGDEEPARANSEQTMIRANEAISGKNRDTIPEEKNFFLQFKN